MRYQEDGDEEGGDGSGGGDKPDPEGGDDV